MKRLIRKVADNNALTSSPPEIGAQIEISQDPKYVKNFANQVTYTTFRDGPIVIVNNIAYFGEKFQRHSDLLYQVVDFNDPNIEDAGFGYGYFLADFMGKPSVFFDNYDDAIKYKDIVLQTKGDCLIYYIKDVLNFERVAKRWN